MDGRVDILHVIVGDSSWAANPIAYRRHRLADYLRLQPSTSGVFWIWPVDRRAGVVPGSGDGRGHWSHLRSTEPHQPVEEFAIPVSRRISLYSEVLQRRVFSDVIRSVGGHPARLRVLWYTVPSYSRLLRTYPWDLTVYDRSDNWPGRATPVLSAARIVAACQARSEHRIIRGSQLLFASSAYLYEGLREAGGNVVLVENGVDVASFMEAGPPSTDLSGLPPGPRIAFVGSLKHHKIDFELITAVATAAPEWNIVLIGPIAGRSRSFEVLVALPNVFWLGYHEPSHIPSIMKQMDIGILPYREGEYNAGVFPLKLLEYLAAGLPVVGCGLPSTISYVEEDVYIHVPSIPQEFTAACRLALTWAPERMKRLAIARENDWSSRFEIMYQSVRTRLAAAGAAG